MSTSNQDLLKKIEGLNIPSAKKKELVKFINSREELSVDDLAWIEDQLQGVIDDAFDKAGVKLDEDDPHYQAAEKKMEKEIEAAEKEFTKEMEDINKQGNAIQKNAIGTLDDMNAQALRDALISAVPAAR